jgi:hypothetical protein
MRTVRRLIGWTAAMFALILERFSHQFGIE